VNLTTVLASANLECSCAYCCVCDLAAIAKYAVTIGDKKYGGGETPRKNRHNPSQILTHGQITLKETWCTYLVTTTANYKKSVAPLHTIFIGPGGQAMDTD
jgi:hypothetical protein